MKRRSSGPSEHGIQKAIMQFLGYRGVPCYRINAGAFSAEYEGRKRFFRSAPSGFPDLVVFFPWGAGFIEVKSATGRLSEAQLAFKELCERHHVTYIVARSVLDVTSVIDAKSGENA